MILTDSLQLVIERAIIFVPKVISALLVFFLTLFLAGLISRWLRNLLDGRIERREIVHLIVRPVRWTMIIAGVFAALDQVDFDVTTFLAGLGVAGLTIGFALQDIARNFIAGIILLIRQPFHIGEAVRVGDFSGQVVDVNTRDTTIRTFDNEQVILPNMEVFESPIVNLSAMPQRRRTVRIGLGYGQDVERAKEVFLEVTRQVKGIAHKPEPMIHAEELGDSAIILALRFWVNQWEASILDAHSDVIVAVNRAADEHGFELPYPIQTVRIVGKE
jgi:small-conductance mechanosensitive channel